MKGIEPKPRTQHKLCYTEFHLLKDLQKKAIAMGHAEDPRFKVVYLATYYSLTTQFYAAKIFLLYADQEKVMLLVAN